MTVSVENLQGGHGAFLNKLFTDSLLSPDQPLGVGDLWITAFDLINAGASGGQAVATALNRSATGLSFGNGAAGYNPTALALPIRLTFDYVNYHSQFSQVTFVSNVGIADGDLMCFCTQNARSWYGMNYATNTLQASLLKRSNAGATILIAASGATAFVAGDVLRLEAVNTTVGQTTLTMKKNGVSIGSVVDNVSPYIVGMPGLFFNGANPAASMIIKDYSGGTL